MSSALAAISDCVICLEPVTKPYSTSCHHVFCQPCITAWIAKNPSCPTCRTPNVTLQEITEQTAQKTDVAMKERVELLSSQFSPSAAAAAVGSEVRKPLCVHVTLYESDQNKFYRYYLPQGKGIGKAVKEAFFSGKVPIEQQQGKEAAALFNILLFAPPCDIRPFIGSNKKTFTHVCGLSFNDKTVTMTTNKCDLVYRARDVDFNIFEEIGFRNALRNTFSYLISQPNQLQISTVAHKDITRELRVSNLEASLKKIYPEAKLKDVISCNVSEDPEMKMFVGITDDKPEHQEPPISFTLATTIDHLFEGRMLERL